MYIRTSPFSFKRKDGDEVYVNRLAIVYRYSAVSVIPTQVGISEVL
jgi:hypothetical protein